MIHKLTKIVYYKLFKIIIDVAELAKVIIIMVVKYDSLPDFIMSNRGAIFFSKFLLSLCYFLGIKQRLFIAFYS